MAPVLERELRVQSRRRETYWIRFAVGLLGLLVTLPQILSGAGAGVASGTGATLLGAQTALVFILCCAASLLSCDLISAERREGTLGLLFLTRIKAKDVLAGKLLSVGLVSLCALGAIFPVILIAVFAGGVSGSEICRKGVALLFTLLLCLAAGLCASATHRDRFKAIQQAVLTVLFLVFIPLLFQPPGGAGTRPGGYLLSPLSTLKTAESFIYAAAPKLYWESLTALAAVTGLFLAGTIVLLKRAIYRDNAAPRVRTRQAVHREENALGLSCWRPTRGESPPIEWVVFRKSGIGAWAWLFALLALALSRLVALWQHLGGGGTWIIGWPLGFCAAIGGGILLAWVSSRYFVRATKSGELELLLTTPVGAKTIVSDQWRVIQRLFPWPILAMQLAMIIPAAALIRASGGFGYGIGVLPALLSIANTLLGTMAVCWVAFWFGLTLTRQITVVFWTALLVEAAPWLFNLACNVLSLLLLHAPLRTRATPSTATSWLPEAAVLAYNLWLLYIAPRKIAERLNLGPVQSQVPALQPVRIA
jgi:hypothetical protein